MDSTENERTTAAGYDNWAASYDDQDPSTWLDEPFLLRHLNPFSGCRILDIGCGTGRYLRRLTTSSSGMIGVDLSRNMLARARQDLGAWTDIRLVQASVGRLPFKPDSFDRIMSGLVIDHVASPETWFCVLSSLLKKDGGAILAAVHPDMQRLTAWDIEIHNSQEDAIHIPGHIHEVDVLLSAARRAGFTVVAMEDLTADKRFSRAPCRMPSGSC